MTLSDSARNLLAVLWKQMEQPSATRESATEAWRDDHAALAELEQAGLVYQDICAVGLTEQGWLEAAQTVHCQPLSTLTPGDEGRIACVQSHDQRAFQKLMAMGILPGNPIRLLRRSPAYVFQVGFSQFAVDKDIAEKIYIRSQQDSGQN